MGQGLARLLNNQFRELKSAAAKWQCIGWRREETILRRIDPSDARSGAVEDGSMTAGRKKAVPDAGPSKTSHAAIRREQRYPIPGVYQRYISLKVRIDKVFVPVILHNFSGSGVLFESNVPFKIGAHADCAISISLSLSREIAFAVRVKHCRKKDAAFYVGAAIETVADATWFSIFKVVHDFILKRQGDVY